MARVLMAAVAGLLFGLGLAVSQMVNPAKVLAFLDIAGDWDPSLALVMAAALAVSAVPFWLARHRTRPFLAEAFAWPTARSIDGRLISGAAIFGVGWGLVGLCPGPAVASFAYLRPESVLFVAGMIGGIVLARMAAARGRGAAGDAEAPARR